jgi:hypothetical protein
MILLLILLGNCCLIDAVQQQYRYLRALPSVGFYNPGGVYSEYLRAMRLKSKLEIEGGFVKADRGVLASFHLAPRELEAETLSDDSTVLRSVVPVPIRTTRDDVEASLIAAMSQSTTPSSSWKGAVITDRDRGLFDSLAPLYNKWLQLPMGAKDVYNAMKNAGSMASPYHCFISALDKVLNLVVTGLIIEVADSPSAASLSLGAAVLVSKKGEDREWVLTKSNFKQLASAQSRMSSAGKFLDCYVDEALGVHFATQIPIVISESLYQRICVDALLEKRDPDGATTIRSPFFESRQKAQSYERLLDESRARPAKIVKKLDDIRDATTFLKMRVSEKRACLRSSGVLSLPKPREGPKKVDAIMIPLLDEEVAYEVLRRLGECKGDFTLAANMRDFESRKPTLARQYNEAVRAGDSTLAKKLIEELNSLSTLRYDPSNPEEEAIGFDIEEWYWQTRKRIHGIIA